jgi:hypothetical protein
MTIETDNSGFASSIGEASAHVQPVPDAPAQQGNGVYGLDGQGTSPPAIEDAEREEAGEDGAEKVVEAVVSPRPFNLRDVVPGFEDSASHCLNRALQIARSLNQTSLSSDHLMLALTMDPNARRHLERVGDVAELRETAMLRLGKMNWRFAKGADADTNGDPGTDLRFRRDLPARARCRGRARPKNRHQ